MKNKPLAKYLFDIIEAINAIQNFITGTKEYSSFVSSRLLTSAIERELQVIGEAINCAEKINHLYQYLKLKR